jgi:uncharacterized protein (TIGR03067 family)
MSRILIASIIILSVGTACADDKPATGELAKLQGTWEGRTGRDGRYQTVMTFKKDTGATDNTTVDGKKIGLSYKFEIDEKADPKRIHIYDIIRYGGNGSGPAHVYGIYRFIDPDTIEFCNGFDGRYPTEFKNGEPGSSLLFTLKRGTQATKADK